MTRQSFKMRMILLLLLPLLLCACNSDIFVDDFTPDVSEVTMAGEHSAYTIHFKSDDWSLLTFDCSGYDGMTLPTVVTPVGGGPSRDKTLKGDGTIALHTSLTDITVTRRGADVTVAVNYAIGNEPLHIWLVALSELTYDRHEVMVNIDCVGGLEIADVRYTLNTWGELPEDSDDRLLASYIVPQGVAPVVWSPDFKSGLLSFYKITTTGDSEEYLAALAGMKIPVPTRTNGLWANWDLRGETVTIGLYGGYTMLMHCPPFPQITMQPGTQTEFHAVMMPVKFDASLKVRNKYSGEEHDMIIWLTIEQPEKYFVISNEIQ